MLTKTKEITYGFHQTKFGTACLASSNNQLCFLAFAATKEEAIQDLQRRFPAARLQEDVQAAQVLGKKLFSNPTHGSLSFALNGTPFQQQVWQALLVIPFGSTVSYQDVANAIGKPTAVRAVANAIANNKIAVLIPCHRVIGKSGQLTGYRWGIPLKKALLSWEQESSK